MTKYKKCMDCPFFENKCYEDDSVIGICNKYNCVTSPENTCLTHKRHNHSNYDPELNDTSLPPGVTTKMGAASLSPPLMYKGGTRQPMRGKRQRRVARTALGSEHLDIATKDPSPTHQMAKREHHPMPSNTPSYHDSLRQPLLCPDDCPSKKFCDPSSCALESVREARAIAEGLKR